MAPDLVSETVTDDDGVGAADAAATNEAAPDDLTGRHAAAADALAADGALSELVAAHRPLAVEPAPEFFARFVRSILRQQVSMASAAATAERLEDAVELAPGAILAADDEPLRDAGLSAAKVRYVNNVARAFDAGELSRDALRELDDDAVRTELTAIEGVGPWTANMQLIFSLGRPDVFPVGDLGIRRGMETLFGELTRAEMRDRAERWAPYRSYASRYLWRAADGN